MNIALTVEERNFCKKAGDLRTDANTNKQDIKEYNKQHLHLTSLQANRLGCFVEGAVFKFLGGNILDHSLDEWAHYVPNNHPEYTRLVKRNHDLFNTVEVRRADRPDNLIPIRAKDRTPGAVVVQGFVDYKKNLKTGNITVPMHVTLTGWAYADDKGEVPTWWGYVAPGTLVVPRRPMDTLDLKRFAGGVVA